MTNDGYKALVEKMGAVYAEMKNLVDAANTDGEMSPEVEAKYASLKTQYAAMTAQRQRNDDLMKLGTSFKAEIPDAPQAIRNLPMASNGKAIKNTDTDEYRAAFGNYLKNGEYTNPLELRALSESSGGTVLPPLEFSTFISTRLKTMTAVRQIAKVVSIGSYAREFVVDDTAGTANWKAEAATFAESGQTYKKVTLTPAKLTGLLKVSNELVEDAPARGAGFSIESIISEQFARMFAQAEETAFLATSSVTDGPQNPLLSSGAGITAGKTTASASAITAAEVIDWVYSLGRQYRKNASILVNDATLGLIRKLGSVGGTTGYFWENSGALGEPDRLMGIPVYASAAMPTLAANAKIGIIGDFSNYCIVAERGTYNLRVLKELYQATGQVGYIASNRVDCTVTLSEAFKTLVAGAS